MKHFTDFLHRHIIAFIMLFMPVFASAQGMTVHISNGEKVKVRIADTDSVTFSTDKNFKTEFPKDTIVVKTHTDTIYVMRSDSSVVRPYRSVKAMVGKQYDMARWGIPAGNYSGIAWLGDNRYALVSDKQSADGWQEVCIDIDHTTGNISNMQFVAQHFQSGTAGSARDAEGIALFPTCNTLFISAESDQRIVETDTLGMPTGRCLNVPDEVNITKIYDNYGFEALTYARTTHRFWTLTENILRNDGDVSGYGNRVPALLRLLSFDDSLCYVSQYAYATDAPKVSNNPKLYAFGVPALTALDDGSLLVLEREFYVAANYLGSYVINKIYRTEPLRANSIDFNDEMSGLPASAFIPKTLLTEFTTRLNLLSMNIANYEGMCLGPTLNDGRMVLLLVSDSQDNYGNSIYHLKDYIMSVIIDAPTEQASGEE